MKASVKLNLVTDKKVKANVKIGTKSKTITFNQTYDIFTTNTTILAMSALYEMANFSHNEEWERLHFVSAGYENGKYLFLGTPV